MNIKEPYLQDCFQNYKSNKSILKQYNKFVKEGGLKKSPFGFGEPTVEQRITEMNNVWRRANKRKFTYNEKEFPRVFLKDKE